MVGAYIKTYGSPEGVGDILLARELNKIVCKPFDSDIWLMQFLHAAIVAWWIAEYTGWYVDDQAGTSVEEYDLDEGMYTYPGSLGCVYSCGSPKLLGKDRVPLKAEAD